MYEMRIDNIEDIKCLSSKIIYRGFHTGDINVCKAVVITKNNEVIDDYYSIVISLGSHTKTPHIRNSMKCVYTVLEEDISKVVFGKHTFINTVDGDRFEIEVIKGK